MAIEANIESGLIFLGLIALLSAISTLCLMAFVGYRATHWRKFYARDIKKNVFVVLLFNLFLADFFQAFAFLISFHWYTIKGIQGGTAACTVQGFLINFGDMMSAFCVLAVAVQTWAHIKFQHQLRYRSFLAIVAGIWILSLLLSILGPLTTRGYFKSTGAWCWVNANYEHERLAYHYFWIFFVQFGTAVVYCFVIYELRHVQRRLHARDEISLDQANETYKRISKSCLVMCCYPIAYITLTLPLAAGRMCAMRGYQFSSSYWVFAASFLVSSGWVDVTLYILTRGSFLKAQIHPERSTSLATTTTRPDGNRASKVQSNTSTSPSSPYLSPTESSAAVQNLQYSSDWTVNWTTSRIEGPGRPEASRTRFENEIRISRPRASGFL